MTPISPGNANNRRAKQLDKDYEDLGVAEVLDAPVAALAGVSEGDAEKLDAAFGKAGVHHGSRH